MRGFEATESGLEIEAIELIAEQVFDGRTRVADENAVTNAPAISMKEVTR